MNAQLTIFEAASWESHQEELYWVQQQISFLNSEISNPRLNADRRETKMRTLYSALEREASIHNMIALGEASAPVEETQEQPAESVGDVPERKAGEVLTEVAAPEPVEPDENEKIKYLFQKAVNDGWTDNSVTDWRFLFKEGLNGWIATIHRTVDEQSWFVVIQQQGQDYDVRYETDSSIKPSAQLQDAIERADQLLAEKEAQDQLLKFPESSDPSDPIADIAPSGQNSEVQPSDNAGSEKPELERHELEQLVFESLSDVEIKASALIEKLQESIQVNRVQVIRCLESLAHKGMVIKVGQRPYKYALNIPDEPTQEEVFQKAIQDGWDSPSPGLSLLKKVGPGGWTACVWLTAGMRSWAVSISNLQNGQGIDYEGAEVDGPRFQLQEALKRAEQLLAEKSGGALCKWCPGQMQQIGPYAWRCSSEDTHRFWIQDTLGVWSNPQKLNEGGAGPIPEWAKGKPIPGPTLICTQCNSPMQLEQQWDRQLWQCQGNEKHKSHFDKPGVILTRLSLDSYNNVDTASYFKEIAEKVGGQA